MTDRVVPDLRSPATVPVVLGGVEVLQATFEQSGARGEAMLPAGLAPTIPTLVSLLVVRSGDSPLGPFTLAQLRLSCRSGARARAYVAGQVVDAAPATVEALAAGWGLGGVCGPVRLRRGYDAVEAEVAGMRVSLLDPAPIGNHDAQYVTGLVPVRTATGDERLAQVEVELDAQRTERGRPILASFDPDAWGLPLLRPSHPVAATIAVGTLTLPAVRFLLTPDLPPHRGTTPL